MRIKKFTQKICLFIVLLNLTQVVNAKRPNILFCIADDWGDHAGIYGDKVVQTPNFDALGKSGVIFDNAYVSAPSCAPSRAAIVTGQWHWRLKEAANLYGPIPMSEPIYTDLLRDAGYHVGLTRKGWGPGNSAPRPFNPAGKKYKNFDEFLEERPEGQPFCFWYGAKEPHRKYTKNSGIESGLKPESVKVPKYYPDNAIVRNDLLDYALEINWYDHHLGLIVQHLEEIGELDNTIIVAFSDNGAPFPRIKGQLYDDDINLPMIARWGKIHKGGAVVKDFVSNIDLGPTFLDAAGIA